MTVGIDFGTSTSEISFIQNGKPTLIPNHHGEYITPSVVHISKDGSVTVGREAKDMALLEPENTFLEVKRLFGQGKTLTSRGKEYSPADIASMIIKYLVDCAEKHIGQAVDSAVITVPAYFNDNQRREVVAAGEKAGLTVRRIINEPTAASLDYGIDHLKDCDYIIVYDLGGGTLDVTVLELFEGVVEVKATSGNNTLGGKDFDEAIMEFIADSVKKADGVDLRGDIRAMMRVKSAAEQAKIALSEADSFLIELPFLYSKNGEPREFSKKISRTFFEGLIKEKIYSTYQQIKTALFDAELSPEDIELVLLVGGSTRIPLVSAFLDETYNFKPKSLVDPDLAVVRGAALQAGVLSGDLDASVIVLTDVCPYSLSTEVMREYGEIFCDILIRRNTTLPVSVSKLYQTAYDYQHSIISSVFQGEGLYPADNLLLNKMHLSGIPKAKAGKEKINVTFSYDLNSILVVSAEIVSTGKSAEMTFDTSENANADLTKWKEAEKAKLYRREINKADRLIKLGGNIFELENAVSNMKKGLVFNWDDFILDDLKAKLKKAIDEYEEG